MIPYTLVCVYGGLLFDSEGSTWRINVFRLMNVRLWFFTCQKSVGSIVKFNAESSNLFFRMDKLFKRNPHAPDVFPTNWTNFQQTFSAMDYFVVENVFWRYFIGKYAKSNDGNTSGRYFLVNFDSGSFEIINCIYILP